MEMKKKDLKRELRLVRSNYAELYEHLVDVEAQYADLYLTYRYLSDFISYKNLSDEYYYFRENACEKQDEDNPFGCFTL